MSTHIEWKPIKQGKIVDIDRGLKWALQEEYGSPIKVRLGHSAMPFLRGLKHGKVKGAELLIEAIDTHGEIDVYETE